MPKGVPDGAKVGGVVSGLSRAYDFDLRTTRIATVVALFVLPPLWLVYIAAWVLLPDTPAAAQPVDVLLRDRRRRPLLVVLAALLVMAVLGAFGSWFLFDGAPWGAMLIGVGVLLWASTTGTFQRSSRSGGAPAQPGPDGTFPPPQPAGAGFATAAGTVTAQHQAIPVEQLPRRPRRPITSIGVGVMVVWFAVVGIGNGLDWWNTQDLWIIVVGLSIVLTSMLVSIVVNRSWVLPFLFFPLLAVLVALCVSQPNLQGSGGDRTVIPATVDEAQTRQLMSTGTMTIDLTDLTLGDTPVRVDAEVGMGRLQVLVPDDVDVVLLTDVGMGQAQVDDVQIDAGVRQTNRRTIDAAAPNPSGEVVLDLRVGMGQIDVRLVAAGN
jgi:phage shock protein PspC (stress-responsive transcriptional regulator)